MADSVTIALIIVVGAVVLFAAWKGRRLDAQIGSMHFELTANGGSGSVKDLVLIAAGHARLAHQRADELLVLLEDLDRRIVSLEQQGKPAA